MSDDTNKPARRPAAFRMDAGSGKSAPRSAEATPAPKAASPRKPRAVAPFKVIVAEDDPFSVPVPSAPSTPPVTSRGWTVGRVFVATLSALLTMIFGVWISTTVEALIASSPVLGWTALALAIAALASAVVLVFREWRAVAALKSRDALREKLAAAHRNADTEQARRATAELVSVMASVPASARGRARFAEVETEFATARAIVELAETELMTVADRQAQDAIRAAAGRVSVVTAVSPRALVDVAYILYESTRLIRTIAEIYGARPGTLGAFRLARRAVEHLAVTGTVALTDGLVQQMVGHGLAARLSTRLGEGLINGLMTVRVGIAAMDVIRPAPFIARDAPKVSMFVADLTARASRDDDEKASRQ